MRRLAGIVLYRSQAPLTPSFALARVVCRDFLQKECVRRKISTQFLGDVTQASQRAEGFADNFPGNVPGGLSKSGIGENDLRIRRFSADNQDRAKALLDDTAHQADLLLGLGKPALVV